MSKAVAGVEQLSSTISQWVSGLAFEDIPADVVEATKLRILDVIGLSIAGGETGFGAAVRAATGKMAPAGPARLWGSKQTSNVLGAAFANGAASQALEYDDTHNESIVHMSSPSVAAAMALADEARLAGRDVIRAVALGNELSCRAGSVMPGQFHKRGFHPSGLFAPFGVCWLAAALYGLSVREMVCATGIVGSFAAGLLQCWVDGTQSKFLHPGWAAQSGIAAANLAHAGVTGPAEIFEGRFGLFASHLQAAEPRPDFGRLVGGLGEEWESRNASFKPFPVAHVVHPYIDALLRLRARHGLVPGDVARIVCPVAPYIVGIVCEPVKEKRRPLSDSHGRVSLQYTLAEALVRGRIGKDAYGPGSLHDDEILALADRVDFLVDESFPGPERFKGVVRVDLHDGRSVEEVEEHNRGSRANPMRHDEIVGKFLENTSGNLSADQAKDTIEAVMSLERLDDASVLTEMMVPHYG